MSSPHRYLALVVLVVPLLARVAHAERTMSYSVGTGTLAAVTFTMRLWGSYVEQ